MENDKKKITGKSVVLQSKFLESKKVQNVDTHKFGIGFKNGDKGVFYSTNKNQMDFVVGEELAYYYMSTEDEYPRLYKDTSGTKKINETSTKSPKSEEENPWIKKQRRDNIGYAMRYVTDLTIAKINKDKDIDIKKDFDNIYGIMDNKLKEIGE